MDGKLGAGIGTLFKAKKMLLRAKPVSKEEKKCGNHHTGFLNLCISTEEKNK